MVFEFSSFFRRTNHPLPPSSRPPTSNRKLPDETNCRWRLPFLPILRNSIYRGVSWTNVKTPHCIRQNSSSEDNQQVKPKHAWLTSLGGSSLNHVTNKRDQECGPSHTRWETAAPTTSHHPSRPSLMCMCFVKQRISPCFSKSWQEANGKLKMGAESFTGV